MENTGKAAVAEFVGTFALIFFGAGTIIATQGQDLVAIALAHGLAIGIMVSVMAQLSGGVFNPALQISLWSNGKMTSTRTGVYIVAQMAGAVAAAYLLKYYFPGPAYDQVAGGIPAVAPGLALGKATLIEATTTFFLMWVVFGTAVDDRGPFAKTGGLTIGLTLTFGILAIGPWTGAAFNPARWLGPALAAGHWDDWFVWIVGPVAGAILAGVAYWGLFLRDKEPATP